MNIFIIGTRGIPNSYGGFEAFAQHISIRLVKAGHSVTVLYQNTQKESLSHYFGVRRLPVQVSKYIPRNLQKIIYVLKSLLKIKHEPFDAAICCGHSFGLFFPFFGKKFWEKLIVNMDGIEWNRSKWGITAKSMLKLSEKLAVKYVDRIVADNREIKKYLDSKYGISSTYISYGANFPDEQHALNEIKRFDLSPYDYGLVIARIEPENQIENAINAFVDINKTLIIVGDTRTKYGRKIERTYQIHSNIKFVGSIYNQKVLNTLRAYSRVYYHGHSVGGTNPSLLDAMACGCIIVAHNNPFNREVLANAGTYFSSTNNLVFCIQKSWNFTKNQRERIGAKVIERAKNLYSWEKVMSNYLTLISD